MNNATAYLVMFPHGVNSASQDFQKLFNSATARHQVLNNVYLVNSTTDIADWYRAIGTETASGGTGSTTGTIGLTTPVVLPVSLDMLQGVKGIPSALLTVINQYTKAA